MSSPSQITHDQRRAAARAERERAIDAQAGAARRRGRIRTLGAAVIATVLVVGALIAISSTGSSSPQTLVTGAAARTTETAVARLLGGIRQSRVYLGSPSAPVTIQYFSDLECPVCQQFTLTTLSTLIANQVRAGAVRLEYRSLQTASRDPGVFRTQQVAALAAGRQNRLWDYVELFYREQGAEDTGYVNEDYLDGLAQQVPGLALATWMSQRDAAALSGEVTFDEQTAQRLGFDSTPSLVVSGPRGIRAVQGEASYAQLSSVIQTVA